MTGQGNGAVATDKDPTKPTKVRKKSRFKRFLERLAKANKESGGQICSS